MIISLIGTLITMTYVIEFFAEYKIFSTILHVFSVIVGMGTALVSDVLFNNYIRDGRIQKGENRTLSTLSTIVWASLGCIVVSGVFLFLSDPLMYASSVKFLVKMTIVGVVIINGYVFHRLIHPSLQKIDFIDTNVRHKYVRLRKLAFACGAVSLISWMLAFVLGMLGHIPLSYLEAIVGYVGILFGGILFAQIVEYMLIRKKGK